MSALVMSSEQAIVAEVNSTVAQAAMIEVGSPEQAQAAVEFLSRLAAAKKHSETARRVLVDPLNAHVKWINERMKGTIAPLDEADRVVRGKLLAYEAQEQQRVAAEQARIDGERREREATAEAARRKQAEAAEEAERDARQAEQARQAQLREADNERAREIAMLNDTELAALLEQRLREGHPEHTVINAEIRSREQARAAQERADTARRDAEEAQQREIAEKSAPAAVATVTALSSKSGSASTSKRWTGTVIDEAQIPRQYLTVDQAAINAAVRSGVRQIPGVRIEQVTGLNVRAGRPVIGPSGGGEQ